MSEEREAPEPRISIQFRGVDQERVLAYARRIMSDPRHRYLGQNAKPEDEEMFKQLAFRLLEEGSLPEADVLVAGFDPKAIKRRAINWVSGCKMSNTWIRDKVRLLAWEDKGYPLLYMDTDEERKRLEDRTSWLNSQ